MSSPSSSSSATAGRLRWTRPRRPTRRSLIEWGAAALAAAALYLTPALLVLALSGDGWWAIAPLLACLVVLVRYGQVFGSQLGLLLTLVLIGLVEFLADVGAATAETCGDSSTARIVELSGAGAILVALGSFGAHHRRVTPVVGAIILAGVWVALVAHVIPGGAGGCFE